MGVNANASTQRRGQGWRSERGFTGVDVMFSTKKGRLWRSHTDRIIHGTKASESLVQRVLEINEVLAAIT